MTGVKRTGGPSSTFVQPPVSRAEKPAAPAPEANVVRRPLPTGDMANQVANALSPRRDANPILKGDRKAVRAAVTGWCMTATEEDAEIVADFTARVRACLS